MNSQENEETTVRDETASRPDDPLVWFLTLAGPFALTVGGLLVIYERIGMNEVWRLVSPAFAAFFLSASLWFWLAERRTTGGPRIL
jgi:hypothetical protein